MNTETQVTDAYAPKKQFFKGQINGGGNKPPMSLEEHDKKVHGGHYEGGPCKFRQQMGIKTTPAKGEGATGAAGTGGANPAPKQKFTMTEGTLTKKFGGIEVENEEALSHLNEIQQIHAECKTPEAREKIEKIYQDLKAKLSGGAVAAGTGGGEKPVATNAEPPKNEPPTDAPKSFGSHEEVDKWYNSEVDKLDAARKGGSMSEEEYNSKLDELDTQSETHHRAIEGSKGKGGEPPKNAPKKTKGASDHRKSLQDALIAHFDEKAKNGTMTEEDVAAGEMLEARTYLKKQLADGKISKEDYHKKMGELSASHEKLRMQKQFAKFTPKKPKAAAEGETAESLSAHREKLQTTLSDLQQLFGKRSLIGMAIGNHYGAKIAEVSAKEAKLKDEVNQKKSEARAALQKMVSGEGGGKETSKTPRDGLRRIVGGVKHNGNKDVQSMIEEIEEEYANAKTRKEKMALVKEFQQMQKTFGYDEYSFEGGKSGVAASAAPAPKTKNGAAAKKAAPASSDEIAVANPNGASLAEKYGKVSGFTVAEKNTIPLVEKEWEKAKANGDAKRMEVCENYWKRLMRQDKAIGSEEGDGDAFDSSEEGLEMISFAVDSLYSEG